MEQLALPHVPQTSLGTEESLKFDSDRRCILHVKTKRQEGTKQDVTLFGEKQWDKVRRVACIRRGRKGFQNSVYFDVVQSLPEYPGKNDGYHLKCYKNFTAVPQVTETSNVEDNASQKPYLSPETPECPNEEPSSSGISPRNCVFCGHMRKRNAGGFEIARDCETFQTAQGILDAALTLKDEKILEKVSGVDLIEKRVTYHSSCKSAYMLLAKRRPCSASEKRERTSVNGPILKSVIEKLYMYIEEFVIRKQRPELMTSLFERYNDMCTSASEKPLCNVQSLRRNIEKQYSKTLKFQTPLGKKLGLIIYSSEMSDNAVRIAYDYAKDDESIITKAALLLRKVVKTVEKKDLPEYPCLNDFKSGNVSPPELLIRFFTILYSGEDTCDKEQQARRVKSSCDDALFIVNKGRVKPQKHVALGMALKSFTGSKKVLQVLNRFGHCLNYHCLEELETAIAERIQEREEACPEGTEKNVAMGLAFDNFDVLTQTLSGADTLHDTMGILYHNVIKTSEELENPESSSSTKDTNGQSKKGRKRKLDFLETELEPYRKKPKMTIFSYKETNVFSFPATIAEKSENQDHLWMMSHAFRHEEGDIPMWVGYNARTHQDKLPRQAVHYMANLKQPITSLESIQQTLRITQRCAKECGQKFGIVTYDLNVAKPAMQIQATEKPQFDDVFIMLGAFHIEMAFFKAIGKLISASGGPDMLTETDVLAPGSVNGFLSGKNFNRCKRMHPLLALAFEVLHFQSFLKIHEQNDNLEKFVQQANSGYELPENIATSDKFKTAIEAYEKYRETTLCGEHGATARFWMIYINYIRSYHSLERAIRTNDLQLYIYTLTPIIDLFFATNHLNYARWLTKFQLDLMNIDESHPGLKSILENGSFSIRRTDKQFGRIPIDLTLEQTVNADASSHLSAMTNSYSARFRWMVTNATRATFVKLLEEMSGLIATQDGTVEVRPSRMRRDNADLKKVIKQIQETQNPFELRQGSPVNNEKLFNICTGKAAQDCLLKVPENGQNSHRDFLEACMKDPTRFEAKISKVKLRTFADEGIKNRKSTDKRVAELTCTRDLMGRLVTLAAKRRLDLPYILEFPLTPVPLSMCTADGLMTKTDKNKLLHILETSIPASEDFNPGSLSISIIDGQFLLYCLPAHIPSTYADLARIILSQTVASSTVEIHLLFDDYPQPSLKDVERSRRKIDDRQFLITGPMQKRPRDIHDALKSRSFKMELPKFLAEEWQDSGYGEIIGQRVVYLDIPGACYKFQAKNGIMERIRIDELCNNHEEADTKICLHAKAIDRSQQTKDIVVRATDTDIAVILLYHCGELQADIWMDVGTAARKNRRYICLSAIHKSLGPSVCCALPAFHAFTGCDYTSSFVRKGKTLPFKKLQNNLEVQRTFKDLAVKEIDPVHEKTLQEFTMSIYGEKNPSRKKLNAFRYEQFEKGYGPRHKTGNLLEKLKGINASMIPPCENELVMHLKRVSFVAKMWAHADHVYVPQHPTQSDGWDLENSQYIPLWHQGKQLPDNLILEEHDMLASEDEDENKNVSNSSDEFESDFSDNESMF